MPKLGSDSHLALYSNRRNALILRNRIVDRFRGRVPGPIQRIKRESFSAQRAGVQPNCQRADIVVGVLGFGA